jgi:hypothetical protein
MLDPITISLITLAVVTGTTPAVVMAAMIPCGVRWRTFWARRVNRRDEDTIAYGITIAEAGISELPTFLDYYETDERGTWQQTITLEDDNECNGVDTNQTESTSRALVLYDSESTLSKEPLRNLNKKTKTQQRRKREARIRKNRGTRFVAYFIANLNVELGRLKPSRENLEVVRRKARDLMREHDVRFVDIANHIDWVVELYFVPTEFDISRDRRNAVRAVLDRDYTLDAPKRTKWWHWWVAGKRFEGTC